MRLFRVSLNCKSTANFEFTMQTTTLENERAQMSSKIQKFTNEINASFALQFF
jgi:hypothetical protein